MRVPPSLLAAAALLAGASGVCAQQYPSKPIRILVGFAAGGPSDVAARTIGQKLTEKWGQPGQSDSCHASGLD